MDLSIWMTFVAASVALIVIPGPTVVLVLTYALTQGRRVAVALALGVGLGDLIAMVACLAGLGALVLASSALFGVVKWLGAAYLVWMGIGMIWSAINGGSAIRIAETAEDTVIPASRVFGNAVIVTALNPKGIVFFIAFVPQFIDQAASLLSQFSMLTATFVSLGVLNALFYALLANRLRTHILRPFVFTWMTRLGGSVLVGMGVLTATLRKAV
jgi:threonine/homoserine/homoserine lactone efflux protein